MPLQEPALDLASDPRSVQEARGWVVSACEKLGRGDLAECAELGVSELVTNALLHGAPPISVRVRGTVAHPRIEVRDGSVEVPEPPLPVGATDDGAHDLSAGLYAGHDLDLDVLLSTFGRGLNIVANCSTAWGTSISGAGKSVWFEPAQAPDERDPPKPELVYEGSSTLGVPRAADSLDDDIAVQIRFAALPLVEYARSRLHYVELRRELRLLSLAHQDDYPLARELSEVLTRFDESFPTAMETQVRAGLTAEQSHLSLTLSIDPASATVIEQIIELFDLADEFCRAQRLLALARDDDVRRFQIWFFGEFVGQARDAPPTAWQPAPQPARTDPSQAPEDHRGPTP